MKTHNAVVEYVDAKTGDVLARETFYEPGLDKDSEARRTRREPHLSYGCGRALPMSAY